MRIISKRAGLDRFGEQQVCLWEGRCALGGAPGASPAERAVGICQPTEWTEGSRAGEMLKWRSARQASALPFSAGVFWLQRRSVAHPGSDS